MNHKIYSNLTESLIFYIIMGLLVGLTTGMGAIFIKTIDILSVQGFGISAAIIMVSVSSFFISPIVSIITGLYIGLSNPKEKYLLMFVVFSSFTGFFMLNIAALTAFFLSTGQSLAPTQLQSTEPITVYYMFLGWENSAALLSAPTLLTSIIAAQIGRTKKESTNF